VVGITTYAEQARWGAWDLPAALLPFAYVQAVADAGGAPLLVPPAGDALAPALAVLDGLLLAGGADLDPAGYGAEPHPQTTGVRPGRDAAERALVDAALEVGLPVLGVCRGMQLLNVALGGTLEQHLPDVVGHEGHRGPPGEFAEHEVRLDAGSRVGRALDGVVSVRSYHHQGVDRVATRCAWPAARPTGRSRRSSTTGCRSSSASSGTPRRATTRACSRRSCRPPASTGRRARGAPRSARTRRLSPGSRG